MKKLSLVVFLLVSGCSLQPLEYGDTDSLSLYSEDVFRLSQQAETAYVQSRWLEASRQYQQLTQLVPGDAFSWFRLGNVYAHQGEYQQAIHAYEMSIERDANQTRVWNNLATTYLMNAQSALMQAWELVPEHDPLKADLQRRIEQLVKLSHPGTAASHRPAAYR